MLTGFVVQGRIDATRRNYTLVGGGVTRICGFRGRGGSGFGVYRSVFHRQKTRLMGPNTGTGRGRM